MEQLQFREIRELLSMCRLAEIDVNPISLEKGSWEVYSGKYRAHVIDVPFTLIYFLSDASKESVVRASRLRLRDKRIIVVYAPSSKTVQTIRTEFLTKAEGVWSATEYLASFMQRELAEYRAALIANNPANYIEPTVTVPAGIKKQFPNPLQLFLTDPRTIKEDGGIGSVAVILAEAGHGKTYVCQYLAASLSRGSSGVLPIFVSSDQWQAMRPEALASLPSTIVSSFRELGAPIPWAEGKEEFFLKIALRAGLFSIIFDGFDEYLLRVPGEINAQEVLATIASLASETGTRVIVTSRSSIWSSSFGEIDETDAATISVYTLDPFNASQAKAYFELSLEGNSSRVNRALQIFIELLREDPDLAGRGFVLVLIANLVAEDEDLGPIEKPLLRLMRGNCDRERKRQRLNLTADQQLQILKDFVFEDSLGATPDTELLETIFHVVVPEFSAEEIGISIQRLAPHPLIGLREAKIWGIRQEQVRIALLALKLLDLVRQETDGRMMLKSYSQIELNPSEEADLGSMLVSFCTWKKNTDEAVLEVKKIVASFLIDSLPEETGNRSSLKRLASLVALRLVDSIKNLNHEERSSMLVSLFPGATLDGLVLFGGMTRFNLSGYVISRCLLDNVRWTNCTFSRESLFKDCKLLAGSSEYCKGLEDVVLANCTQDAANREFFDSVLVGAGRRIYSEEHLKRDIAYIVEKFIGRGGIGFRTVSESDLGKGKIGLSPKRDSIIDAFRAGILGDHHISGGGRRVGCHVNDEAKPALQVLVANNAWTGELLRLLNSLKERFGIA